MIDDEGKNLGVIETTEALNLARDKGLDLVEVSEKVDPPIAKIMDFGRFLYEQQKKEQKSRVKAKKSETKGIRLGVRASGHDEEIRIKQAQKFLEQGHRVMVEMKLVGRERQHLNIARAKMQGFIDKLGESAIIDQPLNIQGGRLSVAVRKR